MRASMQTEKTNRHDEAQLTGRSPKWGGKVVLWRLHVRIRQWTLLGHMPAQTFAALILEPNWGTKAQSNRRE